LRCAASFCVSGNLWAIGNKTVHIVANVIFSCEFIIESMRISRQIDVKERCEQRGRIAPHTITCIIVWQEWAIIPADNTRYYSEPRNMYVRIRQVCISLRWAKSRISRLQAVLAHSDITRGTINRLTRRNPVYFAWHFTAKAIWFYSRCPWTRQHCWKHEYFTGLFE